MSARRGWRETIEPGLYRSHTVACQRSKDHKPSGRCSCPFQIKVPGLRPGTTRMVTVRKGVSDARAERRRLMSEKRPEPEFVVGAGTLDELAAAYFRAKAPTLAPSTVRGREEGYARSVGPFLGHLQLRDLTRARLESWLAGVLTDQGRAAAQKAIAALRPILKAGTEWGVLATNPATGLRLPPRDASEPEAVERVLSAGQLRDLFSACEAPHMEPMLRLAGESALRLGEIVGLRWGDLDLAARRVRVTRSVWQRSAADKVVKPPKSGKTRRVAISEACAQVLGAWFETSVIGRGVSAEGYVFPARDGVSPMDRDTPGQALARVCCRAGLVDASGRPLVAFHGLRHSAITAMLLAGVPVPTVAQQAGHADPSITLSVYSHVIGDGGLDSALRAFENVTDGAGDGAGETADPEIPLSMGPQSQ